MSNQFQDVQCPFGSDWKVLKEIGSGSYGSVYLIERKVGDEIIQSAMKIIRLPASESEAAQMDPARAAEYYNALGESMLSEIQLMSRLRGDSHIVSYEDHYVVNHDSGIGMDIYIRMEYLTPLTAWMKSRNLSVRDVVRLGIELCNALETCALKQIVHRDIKPDNIFVAANDAFKLGDFGIAHRQDHLVLAEDRKLGSLNYIAPEVHRGEEFDSRSDIYGLGMVLYRLLNGGRIPFLPATGSYTEEQETEARNRRLNGEKLPKPANCGDVLWAIIEKACAFHPSGRYNSAIEMRKALEAVATHPETAMQLPAEGKKSKKEQSTSRRSRSSSGPNGTGKRKIIDYKTGGTYPKNPDKKETDGPEWLNEPDGDPVKKKKPLPFIIIGAVVVVAVIILIIVLMGGKKADAPAPALSIQLTAADEQITISAKGGNGPYKAVVYSGGYAVETLSFSSSTVADELIPGTSYTVTVTDANNATQQAKAAVPEQPANKDSAYSVMDMMVYECERQALSELDFGTLMERKRAVPAPGGAISLSNVSPSRQTNAWTLVYFINNSGADAQAEIQLVLRAGDGTAVGVSKQYNLKAGFGEYRTNLDDLLGEMWTTCNEWPDGSGMLEMYIDNAFVLSTKVQLVSGDAN